MQKQNAYPVYSILHLKRICTFYSLKNQMPSRLICPSDTQKKNILIQTSATHSRIDPIPHYSILILSKRNTRYFIFYKKKKSTLVKPAFTAHYSFVVFCIRCAHIKYVGISYRFTASTNPTPGPCAGPYTFSLVTSRFSKKFKLFWCARAVGDEATNQYFFFYFSFQMCREHNTRRRRRLSTTR